MIVGQIGNNIIEQVETENAIYNTSPIVELILWFPMELDNPLESFLLHLEAKKQQKNMTSDYNSE